MSRSSPPPSPPPRLQAGKAASRGAAARAAMPVRLVNFIVAPIVGAGSPAVPAVGGQPLAAVRAAGFVADGATQVDRLLRSVSKRSEERRVGREWRGRWAGCD